MRTYGKLQLDDAGATWKATALEPHVMIKLKKVFAHIPKNADHASFKNTPEHCRDLDWFVSRYPLDISDADSLKLIEGKNAHIKSIEDMEAILRPDYKPRDYAMKIPPRPYQVQPVEILYATKRLLLGDDVGCISGDAVIKVNRGGCSRKITLRNLFNKFHGSASANGKRWDLSIPTQTASMGADGMLLLNDISNVLYRGVKKVRKLSLRCADKNYNIELTDDHEVFNGSAWVRSDTLSVGDKIAVNGKEWCVICSDYTQRISYRYSKFLGQCRSCMYRSLRNNNASDVPSLDKDGYLKWRCGLKRHPKYSSYGIYDHVLVAEAYYLNGKMSIDAYREMLLCGDISELNFLDTKKYCVHHINGTTTDNRPENLEILTHSEHAKRHQDLSRIPHMSVDYAEVVSVLADHKEVDVYDLVMSGDRRNFVADGVVVHNCGKTVVGIAAMTRKEGLPAIVVAQTHLPTQWQQQIEKFSDLTVHVIKGTKPYTLPPADVYIMRYSCLSGWYDTYSLGIFKMAIFDECQELRIQDSNKYRAAKKLSESVEYCLGLSATPIYNYGDEIYSIMNLIKPGCLGEWGDFSREWCHNYGRSVHDPKALGAHLRENHLFIRRTKADVGREMPALTKIVHEIDFDQKELKKIEDISRQLAITTLFGTFTERGMAGRELDLRLRHQTGVGKARYVAEYVKVLLESGVPVLLAGWHRDCYEIYNEVLIDHKPVMYTGSESSAQKEKSKMAFISGETNLMIISLRSGIGLDGLQERCSTVAFGELDWSGQVHEQVIGRVNRDGQKDPVTAIFLTVNEGSDPPMIELLGVKSSQSKNIIDPFSGAEVQNSDDSRVKALAESVLRARGVDVEALRKEHEAKKASNQLEAPGILTQPSGA